MDRTITDGPAADTLFSLHERMAAAADPISLQRVLRDVTRDLGAEMHALLGYEHARPRANMFYSTFPLEWQQRYADERYADDDPLLRAARLHPASFLWRDGDFTRLTKRGPTILKEAAGHGIRSGFTIPFWGPMGFRGLVIFAGERVAPGPFVRASFELLARTAFERAEGFASAGMAVDRAGNLTDREIECLSWSAAGKTAWEISEILSLSERTVESYFKQAAARLGARTRVQAVAIALRMGLIS